MKSFNQNGHGRLMHKFCKDEGYESSPSGTFGITNILIRFTKGMDLMQSDDDL